MTKHIIASPGHGGKDSGALYKKTGLMEKTVAWNFVNEFKKIMEKTFDVEVIIIQPSTINPNVDFKQDLYGTINEANRLHKIKPIDFYFSFHDNAGGGIGFESFTYTSPSAESERVRKIVHTHVAGFLHKEYNIVDRGMKQANFAEVRETHMPAALFENLFIDNDNEAKLLADPVFINKLANEYAYAFSVALDLKRK